MSAPDRSDLASPPAFRTLPDLLAGMAARYPNALAALSIDESVSFASLLKRANRVAASLAAIGVTRGDRIGLLACNGVRWLEVCLGTGLAGGVLVPFSTWSTLRELDFLLEDSGIRVLIMMDRFEERDFLGDILGLIPECRPGQRGWISPKYPKLRSVVTLSDAETSLGTYEEFLKLGVEQSVTASGRPQDDALVLYTSGSSNRPKAVRLVHGSLVENGFNIGVRQGLVPGDRVFLPTPLFWSYGSANALPASFGHGAALVLQRKFDSTQALELIESHRCTAIYTLPSITAALLRSPKFSPARVESLRTGLTIGSPQDVKAAAERLGVPNICNIYGLTETYGNCSVTDHRWPIERRACCQGLPLPGMTLRIVDPRTGEETAPGVAGGVEVKGHVTPGYAGASAARNESAFTPDGFFRTGDIGMIEPSGAFVFVGRGREIIKRGGINLSPIEIEEVLLQHEKVLQAGVVGAPDPELGEVVFAFVVPAPGEEPTPEELKAHCRRVASKYKTPDRILMRSFLPATATGKLMRRNLQEEALRIAHETER